MYISANMKFLKQPYPVFDDTKSKGLTALVIGVFVWFFLYLFQPFGLNFLSIDEAPVLIAGYGLVTFGVLLFNFFLVQWIFSPLFSEDNWTVSHQVVYILWLTLNIGIGNALYTGYVFNRPFSLDSFLYFQAVTLAVAVIPVSFLVLINQIRLLRRNEKQAEDLSSRMRRYRKMETEVIKSTILSGENADDQLEVEAVDIICINAAENYVEVYFRNGDAVERKLLRSTLKSVRQQLREYTSFYRCHRSWIVNLDHVSLVKGNAQGYRLVLDKVGLEVPVSRTLNHELDSRLAK